MRPTASTFCLAGSPLRRPSGHICAFFHSKEEEYRVLMPFIKEGIDTGERAFHVIDPLRRDAHLRRLAQEGIDVDEAQSKGLLDVRAWHETYFAGGCFDQYRMIESVQEILGRTAESGAKGTRVIANMEWALEEIPGVHDIVEYEARLNYILPESHDPVICTYDLSRFDASLVVDVLRTHPMVMIGGMLQENPFFVPPGEMLEELRERASACSIVG